MAQQQDEPRGFWFSLWTVSKFVAVLLIVIPIAVLMIDSSQPTVTPEAAAPATPGGPEPTSTPGVTPTSVPTPTHPNDVVVAGHLYYVKGRTVYEVHGFDAPRYVAQGAAPALSPDGTELATLVYLKNYDDMYLTNLRTGKSSLFLDNQPTDPTNVSTGFTAANPAWSADGSTLYFSWSYPGAANPNAPGYFDRLDLSVTACSVTSACNTSTGRRLSQPSFEAGGDDEPTVRPQDPSTLVFTSYNYVTTNGIPRIYGRLESLNPASDAFNGFITPPMPSVLNPAWDPLGRYLAFVERSADEQSSSIYVMTYHPTALSQSDYDHQDFDAAHLLIHGSPFAVHPVFSPDGKHIAYVAIGSDGRFHLFTADVRLGKNPGISHVQEVRRAGIIDADRLIWAQ